MPMQRYSSELNSPSGDEGDSELLGVDEWSAQENIKPGNVQSAQNMDFTSGDAVTRGGFVALPGSVNQFIGTDWTIRTSAADNQWLSVAYGNNLFVAVSLDGSGNRVMTSPDGITWTSRASAADNQWMAVTYGAGLFVAVAMSGAGNRVMTSPDGVTWTLRTSAADNQWRGLTYANGLFVAVAASGTGNRVMTSPDGITWTSRTSAADNQWFAVTYGNGLYVAVAFTGTGDRVMTSPDGITWTLRTSAADNQWTAVTYGAGLFVAVAISGTISDKVMTSPDGITWTTRTAAADNQWRSVIYASGIFIAVAVSGTGNRVMTSPDGITWTIRTSAADNQWLSVIFGNGLLVAVANSGTGNRVMTSGETVWASSLYSDPSEPGSQLVMFAVGTSVKFVASGRTTRTVNYATGESVSNQSTIVQCNNLVYLFRGPDETPLYWDGNWANEFVLVPNTSAGAGFSSIPNSNQATYYQNRLWVVDGKDLIAASDVLDFTSYDDLANAFNLNTGDSNFLVTSYPFGENTLLVFKNRSIIALQNVQGALDDVTATEVTRQVGAVGINAVVSVGPDVVYMSDRNINLITLTSTNNSVQHKTLPLSRNIQKIFNRVNWDYAYKVSMGYLDNKLYVALPLDNATVCNTVVVYNFVTENWFGEWNFDSSMSVAVQNFVVASYFGLQRLHAVGEDGRIFVVGEGQNDISGTVVAEISTSLTTRAYSMGNQNHTPRRLYLDLGTNRPNFSVTAYSEGVSESTEELTDQTFTRSESWIFNDSTYDLTNANDDYNRAGRKDYASGTGSGGIESGTGFLPEAEQEYRLPIMTRRNGRLSWLKVTNSTGLIRVMTTGFEARAGYRNNYIQVL